MFPGRPTRLHHTAYVSKDLEATRRFYEDIIGLPLVATFCEKDVLFGKERVYCHAFFGMPDGSALAFFQFANASDEAEFVPKMPSTPFVHIALNVDRRTQDEIGQRIRQAGIKEPDTYLLEHGYCRSLYVKDPNGMIVELALDVPAAVAKTDDRRLSARADLQRWLAGDHSSNNEYRAAANA
jgi:catechol 2,3-dioxygenase-like lactoylglutathione lyase family enzyme